VTRSNIFSFLVEWKPRKFVVEVNAHVDAFRACTGMSFEKAINSNMCYIYIYTIYNICIYIIKYTYICLSCFLIVSTSSQIQVTLQHLCLMRRILQSRFPAQNGCWPRIRQRAVAKGTWIYSMLIYVNIWKYIWKYMKIYGTHWKHSFRQ
jgi:hypothetical protein